MIYFYKVHNIHTGKWYSSQSHSWNESQCQGELFSSYFADFSYWSDEPDIKLIEQTPTVKELEVMQENYRKELDAKHANFTALCERYINEIG